MLTRYVINVYCLWLVVALIFALVTCLRSEAFRNPMKWLPFILFVPVGGLALSAVLIALVPVGLGAFLLALLWMPFREVVRETEDGLVLTRRIGGRTQILRWTEIAEIHEIETLSFPNFVAVLVSGEQIRLPPCGPYLRKLSEARRIPYRNQELEIQSSAGEQSVNSGD